jgi:uncharacterized OB-fold protein
VFEWFGKVNFTPHTQVGEFTVHLKNGHLMGSRCSSCGYTTYPPRANCPECMSNEFEYQEWSGRGEIVTFTKISAAPTGFEDIGEYIVGVADLEEGGRLVAWFGDSIEEKEIQIGMPVQVVPRIFEEMSSIKVYYTLEKPGTTWKKAPTS